MDVDPWPYVSGNRLELWSNSAHEQLTKWGARSRNSAIRQPVLDRKPPEDWTLLEEHRLGLPKINVGWEKTALNQQLRKNHQQLRQSCSVVSGWEGKREPKKWSKSFIPNSTFRFSSLDYFLLKYGNPSPPKSKMAMSSYNTASYKPLFDGFLAKSSTTAFNRFMRTLHLKIPKFKPFRPSALKAQEKRSVRSAARKRCEQTRLRKGSQKVSPCVG